jgi:lysophospholipase L1-like esterase
MPRFLPALLAAALAAAAVAADGPLVDPLDTLRFGPPKAKGTAALVDGKACKAVRFAFEKEARSTFFTSTIRGTPEWDQVAGLSFWVKGEGDPGWGGLQLIYDDDYAVRYDAAFPVRSGWSKVELAWSDFAAVLPGKRSLSLDPAGPNRPSKVSGVWVGKWYYWGDYPALTFALDDLRLAPAIERDRRDHKPAGPPLARVLAKLKARQPVTVVTVGDSLTDTRHWANRQTVWHGLLREKAKAKYGSDVTVVNPAVGGSQLRQGMVLVPTWREKAPDPDLVTLAYGFNDWDGGMRGEEFFRTYVEAVDRVRRATGGKADVLILTTTPALPRWDTMAELSEACRRAAKDRNAGLADTERAFNAVPAADREKLFVNDRVHLAPPGHAAVADAVLAAIERQE